MTSLEIAIYGGGGFAREVAWLVQSCSQSEKQYQIVCFVDDDRELQGKIVNSIPVLSFEDAMQEYPRARFVSAIGSPQTRQAVVEKVAQAGFEFEIVIHPNVERSEWVEVGQGTVICAGNILTTNIVLRQHCQINLDCTVGHDVIMDDFATLAPGVHISGNVHLGKRVYVGTGAVIINGRPDQPLIIEDDVVVGAGACVTKSVSTGLTVVGVPARPLQR